MLQQPTGRAPTCLVSSISDLRLYPHVLCTLFCHLVSLWLIRQVFLGTVGWTCFVFKQTVSAVV